MSQPITLYVPEPNAFAPEIHDLVAARLRSVRERIEREMLIEGVKLRPSADLYTILLDVADEFELPACLRQQVLGANAWRALCGGETILQDGGLVQLPLQTLVAG